MLLESLHLICFCGRPASCAQHLVLEMKAKDLETLSRVGWLHRWVLPAGRVCPRFLPGGPEPERLWLTWELLPGAQQASAVDELSLINRVLSAMCFGAVALEERRGGAGTESKSLTVPRHRPGNACHETVPAQLPASRTGVGGGAVPVHTTLLIFFLHYLFLYVA